VSSISVSAETAPDFKLLSTAGATVTLSQFKGKVVFVDFWATWCPPCRKSIPAVEKMYEQYSHNPHVVIVGINVEKDPAATLSFVMKNTLKYTILNDDGSASKAYRISGIPAFFIVGPDGAITKHFVGYQSDMEKDWMTEINDQLKKM
jgi:thiol-disulfide isomerase/thioredoxin